MSVNNGYEGQGSGSMSHLFQHLKGAETATWDPIAALGRLAEGGALPADVAADAARVVGEQMEWQKGKKDQDGAYWTPERLLELLEKTMGARDFLPYPKLNQNAVTVLERRYLRRDMEGQIIERPRELFVRVARHIAKGDATYLAADLTPAERDAALDATAKKFYRLMASCDFMPNSPTLSNAGGPLGQLSACFVLPVGDSMEEIFDTLKSAAIIHKSGGGTGFAFSRLRPANDMVATTKGISSGPVSFMTVFDGATEAVKQGGTRRGANMGILRVDHPDILSFISCKQDTSKITNFNISVAVTDAFMDALERDADYDLINPRTKTVCGKQRAREVFGKIVEHAWSTGEPGLFFVDRTNASRSNPVPSMGPIESTNPCGEQSLYAYDSCNLGSINVANFVVERGRSDDPSSRIAWDALKQCVHDSVHFLDNVVEVNNYPLEQIEQTTKKIRRIGLGVMGWADLLYRLGISYDSHKALDLAEEVMEFVDRHARAASIKLGEQRGVFPEWDNSIYKAMGLRQRNATLTTVAPTGTISIIAGCSGGIEPTFALTFIRNQAGVEMTEVNPIFEEIAKREGFYSEELMKTIALRGTCRGLDEVPEKWQKVFATSHDITPEWHVRMQAAFQKYVDNAISKTINFPHEATPEEVETAYRLAYKLGCKGVTVYRDGSRPEQVLNIAKVNRDGSPTEASAETTASAAPEQAAEAATSTAATVPAAPSSPETAAMVEEIAHRAASVKPGKPVLGVPRARPDIMHGTTQRYQTGEGAMYVVINEDDHGPFEVFVQIGKAGGSTNANVEAIGRLISLALRSGIDPRLVQEQLTGIRSEQSSWHNGELVLSCPDAISKALGKHLDAREGIVHRPKSLAIAASGSEEHTKGISRCPECGGAVAYESGCRLCHGCGWSKCG